MPAGRPQEHSTPTLGAALERDRLEYRVSRLALAIAALRQRANEHQHELGMRPRHIGQAIADFEAQIEALSGRLRDLDPDRSSLASAGSTPDPMLRKASASSR
jgi:hypothetical protein